MMNAVINPINADPDRQDYGCDTPATLLVRDFITQLHGRAQLPWSGLSELRGWSGAISTSKLGFTGSIPRLSKRYGIE